MASSPEWPKGGLPMCQAGGLDDHAEVGRAAPIRQLVAQYLADAHAQRTADATHFQRVRQARVNMIVAGYRVHLGLAAQATKSPGEDDAIMVLVERPAAEFLATVDGLAESFAGEQGMPVQGLSPYRL